MTTDRIFVLMLVIMIPMTGCFGAVDNADAEENDSDTIVNNYYNNTTTVVENYNNTTTIIDTPVIEKFAIGGMADSTMLYEGDYIYHVYTLNTSSGEAVRIHEADVDKDQSWSMPRIESMCTGMAFFYTMPGDNYGLQPTYLPGSYTDCEHRIMVYTGDLATSGWSMIYSIESVTVV